MFTRNCSRHPRYFICFKLCYLQVLFRYSFSREICTY